MKRLLFLLIVCLISSFSFAEQFAPQNELRRAVQSIDQRKVEAQIKFLASDSLRGRKVGSQEAAITASYIIATMYGYGFDVTRQDFFIDSIKTKKGKRPIGNLSNLIFKIKGTDTTQTVVVGAHYDHLGVDKQGGIFNGADDNASGVVAVLQIARAFKEAGVEPRHNVIFAFWDGEETGSLGSKHFVTASRGDSMQIASYMNFDMIGRNTDESRPTMFRYLYSDKMPIFEHWLKEAIEIYSLDLDPDFKPWDNPTTGSDNAPFAKIQVPIVWFHTDGHPDYHKISDTADKLNYKKMVDIIRAAFIVAVEMSK